MRRAFASTLATLALLAAALPAAAQDKIKVGILTELSGPLGPAGQQERDGFLFYLSKSGGKLAGHSVETIAEDTATDPATAINKLKKLAESDKIDVLLGPISSASAAAIKDYVVSQRLPTFIEGTVDELVDGKYIFRTTFTNNADSFLQGYLPGKAGFRKAIAVAPNFNAGQGAVVYFEKGFAAAGGAVVQKILPRLGTPDFGSTLAQFSSEADVGIIFMTGGDAVRFVKQYADYGKKLPLYGYTATVDESLLPAEGKAAIGFVGAGTYFSTIDTPDNKAFVAKWRAAHQSDPAWFVVSGYIAAQMLEAALSKTGAGPLDKEALVKAIKTSSVVSPAGPFRFDEGNNPIQARFIMQIREVDGVPRPVVIGTIPNFIPTPAVPDLPAGLVLPKS